MHASRAGTPFRGKPAVVGEGYTVHLQPEGRKPGGSAEWLGRREAVTSDATESWQVGTRNRTEEE